MDNPILSINFSAFNGADNDYHNAKDFISASALKEYKKSPAHYWMMRNEKKEDTDALIFGGAYHCLVLQPELFEKDYFVFDDSTIYDVLIGEGYKSPRSTNQYKDWKEAEMCKANGKITLSAEDYGKMLRMKDVLMSHSYARKLLSGGLAEQGYMGEIEIESGKILAKIKPDYQKSNGKLIVDLKTCMDASVDGFTRHAADLNYHIQAAFYSDVLEKYYNDGMGRTFIFIAQEKTSPFLFNIYECSPDFINQGRYEYHQLLKLHKYCLDKDTFPGYQIFTASRYGIQELNLPNWANKELNFYKHYGE